MQRIEQLLQKLTAMAAKGDKNELIDIDLMVDHVKAIYAELLELRDELALGDIDEDAEEVEEQETREIEEVEDDIEEEGDEYEEETPEEEEEEVAEEIKEHVQEITSNEIQAETTIVISQYIPKDFKDIRNVIGINDKYLFINELFGSDKENYENTLDELNKLQNYDTAMEWLNENVLFVNEREDNAEIAQTFYDAISTFFSDK